MEQYLYLVLGAVAAGYVCFLIILAVLPRRLKSDQSRQHVDILEDAKRQAVQFKKAEIERLSEHAQNQVEQLDAEIHERTEDMKMAEEDLNSRERTLVLEEARILKLEKELEVHTAKTEAFKEVFDGRSSEIKELKVELVRNLEKTSGSEATAISKSLQDNMLEGKQMERQRILKFLDEELSSSAKKLAVRTMSRAMARYTPEFYWPKSMNSVEVEDRKLADRIAAEGTQLLADMKEKAEIEVELLANPEHPMPVIKLAGGAGINREAVRLALTDILPKGAGAWAKGAETYNKYREQLEREAETLGRKAIREVQLAGIHPEVQRMVGWLNWRTSYRQNQWYHTVEVATLAGIIAAELGVDPDAAKRVGLLHDIGKSIDYRIEGSHAVISGDYADRFGESRLICDTVMSHHSDLLVESPLAYVLRAADTLSGARPGARVNLEEGYQIRLTGIESAVRSFPGIINLSIMNGGREVHVEVNNKKVQDEDLPYLSAAMARKITAEVAFPGEIKIVVTRRFEATSVA